jgi:DUF1365 family protein
MHARSVPIAHRFTYPIYMLSIDLDELDELTRTLRLFGHERARPVSLRERDYLGGLASVRASFPAGARITLLTHARVFGYVFNPVSFFLSDRDVVVAEVANTFGKRHRYLLDDRCRLPAARGASYASDKVLHVSPFMDLETSYRWHFRAHDETLDIAMDVHRDDAPPFFTARLTGERRPLTDGELLRALVRYPLMTVQVITQIHFEAAKLWWKGAPFHHEPPYDPDLARARHLTRRERRHDRAPTDHVAGPAAHAAQR